MLILSHTLSALKGEALTQPYPVRCLTQIASLLVFLENAISEEGFPHTKECLSEVSLYKVWNFLQDDLKPTLN